MSSGLLLSATTILFALVYGYVSHQIIVAWIEVQKESSIPMQTSNVIALIILLLSAFVAIGIIFAGVYLFIAALTGGL